MWGKTLGSFFLIFTFPENVQLPNKLETFRVQFFWVVVEMLIGLWVCIFAVVILKCWEIFRFVIDKKMHSLLAETLSLIRIDSFTLVFLSWHIMSDKRQKRTCQMVRFIQKFGIPKALQGPQIYSPEVSQHAFLGLRTLSHCSGLSCPLVEYLSHWGGTLKSTIPLCLNLCCMGCHLALVRSQWNLRTVQYHYSIVGDQTCIKFGDL